MTSKGAYDTIYYNRDAWDRLVEQGDRWTLPVDGATVAAARNGDWSIVLTPNKPVPREWFPAEIHGKTVLCLAGGGGQQGPILAAAGAAVTVFDNSPRQLGQDRLVARREQLELFTVEGDMRDLACFPDAAFDLVFHPASNCFVDDVLPVWREAARVLRPGGALLSGFANPVRFLFDQEAADMGELRVRHRIPYADSTSLSPEELQRLVLDKGEPLCFGHTLTDLIQGQIDAGLLIAGWYEDTSNDDVLDALMETFIATRAIKPGTGD